eukprot:gnl/TRDRNA2_/TRDRNA2_40988_c0_seq1.p1 gnl/TRDRNA2_/TRDRNA2_40988_c0~~gnl/TRDRNA2_/TRDRNA2_40988_c0_seq1.p1  ORF type:complete len:450 (-),score=87.27 gnl/TRDRNA2_/TRDRNA2_40988_c0_seq1:26-1375(-)
MRDRDVPRLPPRPPTASPSISIDRTPESHQRRRQPTPRSSRRLDTAPAAPTVACKQPSATVVQVGGRLQAVWGGQENLQASTSQLIAFAAEVAQQASKSASTASTPRKSASEASTPRKARVRSSSSKLHQSCSCASRESSVSRRPPSPSAFRPPLREVNGQANQAHFESLYRDGESRRRRLEQAQKSKLEQEEVEIEESRRRAGLPGPSTGGARLTWAAEALERRRAEQWRDEVARREQEREAQRRAEAAKREEEIMRECSFTPRIISQSPLQRRTVKARQVLTELAKQQHACVQRLEDAKRVAEEAGLEAATPSMREHQRSTECRRFHILRLQLLHELIQLETEAYGAVACLKFRRSRSAATAGQRQSGQKEVTSPLADESCDHHEGATAPDPSTVCPAFDSALVARLRREIFTDLPPAEGSPHLTSVCSTPERPKSQRYSWAAMDLH